MSTIAQQFGMTEALQILGVKTINEGTSTGQNHFSNGEILESHSPVDGQLIAKVKTSTAADYEKVMQTATEAFKTFRLMPAPQRGEIVRQFGEKLRKNKDALGKLVLSNETNSFKKTQNISTHELSKGVYIIAICDDVNSVYKKKLIIY